jgi:hypothetical protein
MKASQGKIMASNANKHGNLKNTVKLVSHAPIKITRMKISYGVKPSSIGGPRNRGIKKAIWGVAIKTRKPKNNCK